MNSGHQAWRQERHSLRPLIGPVDEFLSSIQGFPKHDIWSPAAPLGKPEHCASQELIC